MRTGGVNWVLAIVLALTACAGTTSPVESRGPTPTSEEAKSTTAPERDADAGTAEPALDVEAAPPPSQLALSDDDPLCLEIDEVLDRTLAGDPLAEPPNEIFELLSRNYLDDLDQIAATEGDDAAIDAAKDLMEAADDETTDRCGVPIWRSLMYVTTACYPPLAGMSPVGDCRDPRESLEGIPTTEEQYAYLRELGEQVKREFEAINEQLEAG